MANVLSAGCGSSGGEKSPLVRSITHPTRRLQTDSQNFLEKSLRARWLCLSQTVKLFLPRKVCIARWDIDHREHGWRGATITFRDSQPFLKSLTSSSLIIADSARLLLDCCGEKTYGRQLTFGPSAGFFAHSDSLI